MIIIGEKINGTRKPVGEAIKTRDKNFIQDLALQQVKSGANWLDVNSGISSDRETEELVWLVNTVQAVTDIPLCLDSPSPDALVAAIDHTNAVPMINSINGESKRLESLLPIVRDRQCPVIMLAMDEQGIPKTAEERINIISRIVNRAKSMEIKEELLYADPLIMAQSVDTESTNMALHTIEMIRSEFPGIHIVSGLSNVSFGLPARSLINRVFVTLALKAGLDTAILDPMDRVLMSVIMATEMLIGKDRFCLKYTEAFRKGLLAY